MIWLTAPRRVGKTTLARSIPDVAYFVIANFLPPAVMRILSTGWAPEWTHDRCICELIKGYTILKNSTYANV